MQEADRLGELVQRKEKKRITWHSTTLPGASLSSEVVVAQNIQGLLSGQEKKTDEDDKRGKRERRRNVCNNLEKKKEKS